MEHEVFSHKQVERVPNMRISLEFSTKWRSFVLDYIIPDYTSHISALILCITIIMLEYIVRIR